MTKEFTPGLDADESDVPTIKRQVRESKEQVGRNRAKRGEASETHGIARGAEQTADTAEGEIDEIMREEEVIDWQAPSTLEAPPARAGFVQRWVRYASRREGDPTNYSNALREGWRPVRLSNVPQGYSPPTTSHKGLGEVIGVEGLVLCEMPIRMARQRAAYYANLLRSQNEGVDRDIHKDEQAGRPINVERRSRVTTGRRPTIGD